MNRPSILNSIERKFILLIVDLFIVSASINLFINHAIDEQFISITLKIVLFTIAIFSYLILAYILDFFNLEKVAKRRFIISQSIYISALYVFVVFISSIIFFDVSFWRIPLLSFLILTPIQIALWRFFFSNVFKIIPTIKNVLYLYESESQEELQKNNINKIDGKDLNTFYKVRLSFSANQKNISDKKIFVSAIDKIDSLILNVKNYNNLSDNIKKIILSFILKGKEVITYTSFYENIYEALPLQSHNGSFYEVLQLKNKRIRYLHAIFGFIVNFLLALIVGLVFIINVPIVFCLNIFLNKGPLFYTQKRVGQYGNEFKIYKFRSMVVNAEKSGAKMATKNDTRITPFGKVLRAFRIDELPQVISIVKGDMQFIGPRPERKVFVDELNKTTPFYSVRHLVKPGITGWAQVKFKYGENLDDSIKKLEYDLYYIKNKSITLDLRIIFKTVTTVIFSRGI